MNWCCCCVLFAGSRMGKIYDLLIEPVVNLVEKTRLQREASLKVDRQPIDVLGVNQGNRATPTVLTHGDEATSEEVSQKEEECVMCKIIAISTLMMYGTAIILIPTTNKYRLSMKKYLANKNYVLLIFAVHSFFGSGKWHFNAICACANPKNFSRGSRNNFMYRGREGPDMDNFVCQEGHSEAYLLWF